VEILLRLTRQSHTLIPVFIGIARAGSEEPVVKAGTDEELQNHTFGGPLHILIIPASLHPVEEEYLIRFAGYVPR
jgi:diphthine synthase